VTSRTGPYFPYGGKSAITPMDRGAEVNVLLIDDSDIALRMMTKVLASEGHRVHALPSPIGATRAVLHHQIDVVVIDVNHPAMSGDRLTELFRTNKRMDRVGLVLVSGMERQELRRIAQEVRADGFVPKADIEKELAKTVAEARRKRPS
jgi:CheY-like chemotaxis protein